MIRARGKSWEVVVYAGRDPLTGKERHLRQTVHGTKTEARAVEKRLKAKAADGATGGPDVTVDQLLDRWLEVARHEQSTRYQTERALDRHVRPTLGRSKISRVSPATLDALYLHLERESGLAPSTIARIHSGMIGPAFEQAVRWEWLDRNPARRARPPSIERREPDPPSPTTVRALLAAAEVADPELFTFIRLSADTSMRRGEVDALRRRDVDLEDRTVHRTHALGQARGKPYEKTTKTGARDRVAISPGTAEILAAHLARQDTMAIEMFDVALGPGAYLFSRDPLCEEPWRPDHATKRFARLRAQVPGAESVRLRELRHFVATRLLDEGVPITAVSARLAHSRKSTTLDKYAGSVAETDRHSAGIIGRVLDGDT